MSRVWSSLLCMLVLSAFGCAYHNKLQEEQKDKDREAARTALFDSANRFYQHMLWGRFQKSSEFIEDESARILFLRDVEKNEVKITKFRVIQAVLDEDNVGLGTVYVDLTGVRRSDLVVVTQEYAHRWYADDHKRWRIYYPYQSGRPEDRKTATP